MSEILPYRYKEEVSEDLHCSFCLEVFDSPCKLQCGHVFCKDCLSDWYGRNNTCPVCRRAFQKNQIKVNRYYNTLVQSLIVYCSSQGCIWSGPRKELKAHVDSCKYSKENMDWAADFINENSDKEEASLFSSLFDIFGNKLKSVLTEEVQEEQNGFDFILNMDKSLNESD